MYIDYTKYAKKGTKDDLLLQYIPFRNHHKTEARTYIDYTKFAQQPLHDAPQTEEYHHA